MENYLVEEFQKLMLNTGINLTDTESMAALTAIAVSWVAFMTFILLRSSKTTEKAEIKSDTVQIKRKSLNKGLEKTRNSLLSKLGTIFEGKKALSSELLEEIHEVLFRTDMGFETADYLISKIEDYFKTNKSEEVTWEKVKEVLKVEINAIFEQNKSTIAFEECPFVALIIGVNGVGKTTSCGKLASKFSNEDKSVLLAAADTYRAAAIEQLQVWGERSGVDVISHKQGADPASVAFDAVKSATAKNKDILLIDTAGRLHNKKELMEELAKINKIIKRDLPKAPHETWIVIDATTGQNAFQQVKSFSEVTKVSGIIVTKLDGTAKGGVVIGIANKFKLPIRYIGIGEQIDDLREFDSEDFTNQLFD